MIKLFKKVLKIKTMQRIVSAFLVFTYFSNQVAFAASEIIGSDNCAAPTIVNNANVYDVATQKYVDSTGVNSFDKFNVGTGDIVNLRFNADKLINLIYDSSASQINGEVNSYKNGAIGGNVVFANSNGFVVGSTGVFNVGSLTMTTPTKSAMDDIFTKDILLNSIVDGTKLNKILNFDAETSDKGSIIFNGTVNAARGFGLAGSSVNIGTTANITANKNLDMTDALVNTASTATGVAAIENGKIIIKAVSSPDVEDASADNTVNIAGKLNANKADIDISSYSKVNGKSAIININSGADIKGNNVNINAFNEVDAKSKSKGISINLDDFDLADFGFDELASKESKADAQVNINSGSKIGAEKDVTVEAKTKFDAGETVTSENLAIYVGEASSNTAAIVNSGATITAGNTLNVKATSDNTMDSTAKASAGSVGSVVVTVSSLKNTTSAIINSGAVTQVKNLAVNAESKNVMKASTSNKVMLVGDANNSGLGAAVVVTDLDTTTTAKVNNNLTITGDLSVNAKTTSTIDTKANASAGGKGESKDGKATAWLKEKVGPAALVKEPAAGTQPSKFSKFINPKIKDALKVKDSSGDQFNKIDLSASLNYNSAVATTTASIGDATTKPTVQASTIKVNAENINDKSNVIAISEATNAQVAIGGAVAINVVDNQTNAFINANATSTTTDATKTGVSVTASNAINHPLSYYDDWNTFMTDGFKSLFTGVAFSNISSKIGDNLDKIDFNAYNPDDYVAGMNAIATPIKETLGKSMPSFDIFSNLANTKNLGLESLFTTYAQAANSAQAAEGNATAAISATVAVSSFTNTANAYIAPSAHITSNNDIKVDASNNTDNWTMAGLFKLTNITSMLSGNTAKNGAAVGGSITVSLTDDNASAYIGNNSVITATNGDVIVNSLSDENTVTAAAGSSSGDKAGITGSVAVTNITGTTQSYVDKQVTLNADKLDLKSNSNPLVVALTLGIASSQQGALGIGVSVINLDNEVKSYIEDSGKDAFGNNIGSITLDSTTESSNITADSSPIVIAVSVSGALANPKKEAPVPPASTPPPSGTGGTQGSDGSAQSTKDFGEWKTKYTSVVDELKAKFAQQQKTIDETGSVKPSSMAGGKTTSLTSTTDTTSEKTNKFSLAGAGGVNVNAVNNVVSAYVNEGAVVKANNLNIKATSSNLNIDIATGLAYAGSVAAGGAINVDWFNNDTSAYIAENAQVDVHNKLDISATEDDNVIQVNLGAAAGKDNTGVGGSVGIIVTDNKTNAYIGQGAKVNTISDASLDNKETQIVKISANDTTEIVRAGGAAGYGKNAGVGLTLAVDVLANQTKAYIANNAEVNAKKSLEMSATTNDRILNIGVGGAASQKVAAAGVVSVQVLANTTEASVTGANINKIANQPNKSATQSVSINAGEDTKLLNITGAGAAGGKVGVGASSIVGVSNNTVNSFIKDSTVNAAGDVTLNNSDTTDSIDIVVSGSQGSTAAVTGAFGVFVYNNKLNNYLSGSTVNSNNVSLNSSDTTDMIAIVGSGAAGGDVGVGGSVFVTVNNDDINTYINNACNVTAQNNVSLSSLSTQNLIDVIASGSGGGTAGVTAAIGAIVVTGKTNSYIDGSTVTAKGTDANDGISVLADNDSNIISIVGQANYGGTAGVGGSANTTVLTKSMNSYVDNSTLTSYKDVKVASESTERMLSVVVGAGGGGDVGVQGSFDTYVITNEINSYINDSTVNVDGNTSVTAQDLIGDPNAAVLKQGIVSLVGAVSGGGTVAVGVSAFTAAIAGTVQAYVADTTLNSKGNLTINSVTYENIVPVVIGGSGAGTVAVAGVVNTTVIARNTLAYADNVKIQQKDAGLNPTAKDVAILAKSDAIVNQGTGAVNGAGTASVGAAIDTLVITENVKAYINNSTIENSGKTTADALASESSIAAILGAGGAGTASVQGAVATRVIANEVNSYILASTINSKGDVKLTSKDITDINAGLAAVGGAGTAAVGASIYTMVVAGNTTTSIKDSTVNTSGNIDLNSESSEFTIPVVISGGGAGTAAVNATTNTVVITRNTTSVIDNTDANQKDSGGNPTLANVNLTATSKSIIGTQTGQANGAGIAGVGASIDTIVITKNVKSQIKNSSDIDTKGKINLTSSSTDVNGIPVKNALGNIIAYIPSVIFGFSGAGQAAVQGSIATRIVTNDVESSINNSKINANSDVNLSSNEDLDLLSIVAAGAGSGGASVGASIYTATVSNNVNSYIYGSTLNSTGDVNLTATANENIDLASLNVAIGFYAGVSGIIDTIVVADSTNAYIDSTSYDAGKKSGNNVKLAAKDDTTVLVVTGQVAGGIAGIGGNVDTTVVSNTVTSKIKNDSKIKASGLLTVDSTLTDNFNTIATAGSGGIVAVQGVASTRVIANNVESSITGNQTTIEANKANIHAKDTVSIIGILGSVAVGGVSVGLTAAVNVINNTINAFISDKTTDVTDTLDVKAEGVENIGKETLTGTNTDLGMIVVSGAVGGQSGAGSISANIINNDVNAYATSTTHTNAGTMTIAASDNAKIHANAGNLAVGAGGYGASIITSVITNDVNSYVGGTVNVTDLSITATSTEELITMAVGFSGAGSISLSGSMVTNVIDTETKAYIQDNSHVDATNNLTITANDISNIDVLAGAASASGLAAVGAAVIVNVVNKDVEASIGESAVVDAGNVTNITADVTDNIGQRNLSVFIGNASDKGTKGVFAVAGSLSGSVGVAGTVIVNTIANTVRAVVKPNANVNQNNSATAKATQSVKLAATDTANVNSFTGSGALGGIIGAGAAVNVNVISNTVNASLGQSSKVDAKQDIEVKAESTEKLDSKAISFAAGLTGISGALSIASIGNNVDSAHNSRLSENDSSVKAINAAKKQANDTLNEGKGKYTTAAANAKVNAQTTSSSSQTSSTNAINSNLGSANSEINKNSYTKAAGANTNLTGNSAVSKFTAPVAYIDNTAPSSVSSSFDDTVRTGATSAFIDSNATVKAGNNLLVSATNNDTVSIATGSGALGLWYGVGASVGVEDLNTTTEAYINSGATIESGQDTTVSANSTDVSSVKSYAGTGGGIIAANGSIAYLNSNKITRSYTVDDPISGVNFNKAENVNLTATSTTNDTVIAEGVSAGMHAVGASVGIVSNTGTTTSTLGSNSKVGKTVGKTVKNLKVQAASTDTAYSRAQGGAFGLAGVGVTYSETNIKPLVTAYINDGSDIDIQGNLTIDASETVNSAASVANGLSVGGFAVGVSEARTYVGTSSKKTESKIGSNAKIKTLGNTSVKSKFAANNVSSSAQTGAYGLIGGNGSISYANISNAANSYIGANSSIDATGNLIIQSDVINKINSSANGRAYGLVAGGYTEATNAIGTSSNAYIDNATNTTTVIKAANIAMASNVTNNSTASTTAGSGGLVSGVGAKSGTTITSNNNAYTGDNLKVSTTTGNIDISANTNNRFSSSVNSSSYGALASGAPKIANSITSNVNTSTGSNSTIAAGSNLNIAANNSTIKTDNGYNLESGAGGIVGVGAGNISSTVNHTTNTTLRGNSITSGADLKASATNNIDVTEKANTEAYGGIPVTDTSVHINMGASAIVRAYAPILTSGRDLSFLANSNMYGYGKSYVFAGGAAPVASGYAYVNNNNSNLVDITTGVNMFANRNLSLQAGGGYNIISALVNADSQGLLWNFGGMEANAYQTITNNINIADASTVKAGEAVNLWSLEGSNYSDGYYRGKTKFYLLFGIPITIYSYGGNDSTSQSANIHLYGDVESGMFNEKTLTLSYDSTDPKKVNTSGTGITMGSQTAVPYDQKQMFVDKVADLTAQRNEILSGDTASSTSTVGGMNADLLKLQTNRDADKAKMDTASGDKTSFDNKVTTFETSYSALTAPADGSKTIEAVKMEAISKFATDNSLTVAPPPADKTPAEQLASMRTSLDTSIASQKTSLSSAADNTASAYNSDVSAVSSQQTAINNYKTEMNTRIDYWNGLASSSSAGTEFYYLPVNSVSIGSGHTSVRGSLSGNGSITAPGNVFRIDIKNNTTKSMLFHNLYIDKNANGTIQYNGASYNNNASAGGVSFTIKNPNQNKKEIIVNNAYDPDDPRNPINSTDAEMSGDSGDLYFTGDIYNPAGDVRITNMTGSVVTEGMISAKNYYVYVPKGAYIQNFSAGVFDTAGSGGLGSIIAGEDVTIIAQMINVNGLIQSGEADEKITINNFNTPVVVYAADGKTVLGYKVNGAWLGKETTKEGVDLYDMISGTSYTNAGDNIKAYWDGSKIQIFRSEIRGGNITLNGEVVSTGNGQLKVVSGFGKINVTNNSTHDMVINKLNADKEVDGKVIINNRPISSVLATKIMDLLQNDKAAYNAMLYKDGYFENNVAITNFIPATTIYDNGSYGGVISLSSMTYNAATNTIQATYSGTVKRNIFLWWTDTTNVSVTNTIALGNDFALSNIAGAGLATTAKVTYKAVFDPKNSLTVSRDLDAAGNSTIDIAAGSNLTTHTGASASRNFSVANLSVADGASGNSLFYYPQAGSVAQTITKSDPIYIPRSGFLEWLLGKQYVYNYTVSGANKAATSPIAISFSGYTDPSVTVKSTSALGASNIYLNENILCDKGSVVFDNATGGNIEEYSLANNGGYQVTNNAEIQAKNVILRTKETGTGKIGSEDNAILVNTGEEGSLYISAGGDISVKAPTGDMNLMAATSAHGNVKLEANKEIVSSSNATLTSLVNSKGLNSGLSGVAGNNVNLISNNSYINADNSVYLDSDGAVTSAGAAGAKRGLTLNATGTISSDAQNDIYIKNAAGNTKIGVITSETGNVNVNSSSSISAAELTGSQTYNIQGKDVILTAGNGAIGQTTDGNELVVNASGKLSATATGDIGIRSLKDIFVKKIVSDNGTTRGNVRLISDKNIKDANYYKSSTVDSNNNITTTDSNIIANNLLIVAIGGGIDNINVDLKGLLTAYAGYSVDGATAVNINSGISISNVNTYIPNTLTDSAVILSKLNDLRIADVKATGSALLSSEKSILGENDGNVDARAKDMTLLAYNGSVGSAVNYFNIVSTGSLTANTTDSVYINSPESINIKEMMAVQKEDDASTAPKAVKPLNNVYVKSDKSILDGSQGESANIVSKYINLEVKNGSIGTSVDDLNVFVFAGAAGIEATAKGNDGSIYISSTSIENPRLGNTTDADSSNDYIQDASGNIIYDTVYSDLPVVNMLADGNIVLNANSAAIIATNLSALGNINANAVDVTIVNSTSTLDTTINASGTLNVTNKVQARNIIATAGDMTINDSNADVDSSLTSTIGDINITNSTASNDLVINSARNTNIINTTSVRDTNITSVGTLNVTNKVQARNIIARAGDMIFRKLVSSNDTTLTTTAGDIIGTEHAAANITSGGNTEMSATGGSVGSAANLLDVSIDGTITAKATDSVYINSLKNLNVKEISGLDSTGLLNNAKIVSKNSILNAATDDSVNIKAKDVVLNALEGIGAKKNKLKMNFGENGKLSAKAIDDIELDIAAGNLKVTDIETTSDINILSDSNIIDFEYLRSENANIRNLSSNLKIRNGIINSYADIYTRNKYVVINNFSLQPRFDSTMRLTLRIKPFYLMINDSNNFETNLENVIYLADGYSVNGKPKWGSADNTGLLNYVDKDSNEQPNEDNDNNLIKLKQDIKNLPPNKFVRWTDKTPELVESVSMLRFAADNVENKAQISNLLSDIKDIIGVEKANNYYESIKPNIKGNRWYDKDATVSQVVELMKLLPPDKQAVILNKIMPMVMS